MRSLLATTTVFVLAFCSTAEAAQRLRIDVTYTDGQILSGPLTPDLSELPASVSAVFVLNGTTGGTYATADLFRSSLVFGDGAWSEADMAEFSTTLMPADAGLAVTALSYQYAAKDTPNSTGKLSANFPLTIQGTDIATGQPYHYQYATSNQTVTLVPEPAGIALLLAAAASTITLGIRRCERGAHLTRPARSTAWLMLLFATFVSVERPRAASANPVVFDTFGPGDSYDGDFRYSAGQSFQFELTQSGPLARITVALGRTSTATTQTSFSVLEEFAPNFFTVLESWAVPNLTPPLPSPGMVVSFDSVLQPMLLAGGSYWLAMGDLGPLGGSLWFFNDQGIVGTRQGGVPNTILLPAFRVELVPEPSAGMLIMAGAALLVRRRTRKSL